MSTAVATATEPPTRSHQNSVLVRIAGRWRPARPDELCRWRDENGMDHTGHLRAVPSGMTVTLRDGEQGEVA